MAGWLLPQIACNIGPRVVKPPRIPEALPPRRHHRAGWPRSGPRAPAWASPGWSARCVPTRPDRNRRGRIISTSRPRLAIETAALASPPTLPTSSGLSNPTDPTVMDALPVTRFAQPARFSGLPANSRQPESSRRGIENINACICERGQQRLQLLRRLSDLGVVAAALPLREAEHDWEIRPRPPPHLGHQFGREPRPRLDSAP